MASDSAIIRSFSRLRRFIGVRGSNDVPTNEEPTQPTVHYGMYAEEGSTPLTYVQNGILAAVLLNGGAVEGANPASYTVESGAIRLTNPTRNGYSFKGWSGTGLAWRSRKSRSGLSG